MAGIGYFPIDFWLFSRRAWRAIDPDLVLLTEGERWPEHIHQASQRGVPVVCVNARMSDKGFRRMMSVRPLVRSLFGGVTRWLTCSHQDTERLLALGFPAERITETGNIKLDVSIPLLDPVIREQLRRELGLDQPLVLLGSSTWPGEEAAMIEAWRAARDAGLPVSLLLVPRHAERRAELASLLSAQELSHHFRSKGAAAGPVAVSVADTTGELRKLTQLADLVFVGKSLPPHHEGQTPVEAAALAKPVIFGPDLSNFRQIAKDLRSLGAVRSVRDAAELKAVVVELLRDSASRERMAAAAQAWFKASQGALARTVAALREVMPS
jgi:3-deoxy-D-manno-octulosonic-acid transferase